MLFCISSIVLIKCYKKTDIIVQRVKPYLLNCRLKTKEIYVVK